MSLEEQYNIIWNVYTSVHSKHNYDKHRDNLTPKAIHLPEAINALLKDIIFELHYNNLIGLKK